jgi:hypothetical protein
MHNYSAGSNINNLNFHIIYATSTIQQRTIYSNNVTYCVTRTRTNYFNKIIIFNFLILVIIKY